MFERILMTIDSVSASLGLLRAEAKVRPGVNPWGYKGDIGHEMVENPHGDSFAYGSKETDGEQGLSDDSSMWSQEKSGQSRS